MPVFVLFQSINRKEELHQLAEEAVNRKLQRAIDVDDSDAEDEPAGKMKHSDKVAKAQRESSDRQLKTSHSDLQEIVDGSYTKHLNRKHLNFKTDWIVVSVEIVEGDEPETLTPVHVLRQLGGKLQTPFGSRQVFFFSKNSILT